MFDFVKKPIEDLTQSVFGPATAWVLSRSWPIRAALLSGLLATGAILYWPTLFIGLLERAVDNWRVAGADRIPPLSAAARANVEHAIARLKPAVVSDLAQLRRGSLTAWSSSQAVVALTAAGTSADGVDDIARFVREAAIADCFCWTERPTDSKLETVGFITGWVMTAFSDLRRPVTEAELDQALSLQNTAGWWPMFSNDRSDQAASTYATAWMLKGLHRLRMAQLIPPQSKPRVTIALRLGASWLLSIRDSHSRWKSFPNFRQSPTSDAISALALHVLHELEIGGLEEVDRQWLSNLPREDILPSSQDNYYTQLPTSPNLVIDHFAQIRLPWLLIATIDAYPNGSVSDRAAALSWLENTLDSEKLGDADRIANDWWRAELLIGLGYLQSRINAGSHPSQEP